ncbi:MAG TPA: M48 family metallopeptidase [Actinomycetota bacterium]|nr:M48 family metallopeptidase [Actinomycetota bacterium]
MSRRRLRLAIVAVLVGAAGLAAGSASAAPEAQRSRARLEDHFTGDDIERSRRYNGPRYALSFAAIATGLVAGAAMGLGPGVRRLGRWSASVSGGRWWLQALILAGVVTAVIAIVELPFGIARFTHDRNFELVTQPLSGYLADAAKGLGFQLVLAAVTALGFFGIVRLLPRGWPLAAAGFAVALTVALVYLLPVVYEPLFNKFTPVEGDVRRRVLAIAERARVPVGEVLVADASRRTTRQNAYVSGLGATKRVVLYDTLLAKSSPAEVDLVVAHELAHVAHRDVLKGTVIGCAGAALAVLVIWRLMSWGALHEWIGASGPGDPRWLPFLAALLAVASFVTLPLQNWFSRGIEADADRAAIAYTSDPDTAIAVEVSLARSNIADLEPNAAIVWAFYTHPPVLERIQIALDAKTRLQGATAGG